MPRLKLIPHLSYAALTERFRQCRDGRPKLRWQALWLLSRPRDPLSAAQAAAVVGLTADAIRKLVRRYNTGGPAAVERNAGGQGRAPRLSLTQQQQLQVELLGRAPDGGLWTGPKVARRIAELTGRSMHKATGWEWLRRLGFTPQRPRPRHCQAASAEEQAAWKKKLARRVRQLRAHEPARPVELWCEDECRIGLVPIVRRIWAPKGKRPTAPHQIKREWLYVYGLVRPGTAETFGLLLPEVNTEWMGLALAEWARWVDPQGRKRLVLVTDGARWHTSGKLVLPQQVELFPLPANTPELQPVESAWPLLREVVANEAFEGLEPLMDRLADRCKGFMEHPESIQEVVAHHWAAALNQ
jgi:transposase